MIPTETIAELKVYHADAWQHKRAAGLTEQQVAQVILSQIAHDEAHPPELELISRARAAQQVAVIKVDQAVKAAADANALVEEIRRSFPDAELSFVSAAPTAGDLSDLSALLEEHRAMVARHSERIAELEGFLDEQGKRLAEVLADAQCKAGRIEHLEHDLKAAQEAVANAQGKAGRIEQLEADLKAAQEAAKGAKKK